MLRAPVVPAFSITRVDEGAGDLVVGSGVDDDVGRCPLPSQLLGLVELKPGVAAGVGELGLRVPDRDDQRRQCRQRGDPRAGRLQTKVSHQRDPAAAHDTARADRIHAADRDREPAHAQLRGTEHRWARAWADRGPATPATTTHDRSRAAAGITPPPATASTPPRSPPPSAAATGSPPRPTPDDPPPRPPSSRGPTATPLTTALTSHQAQTAGAAGDRDRQRNHPCPATCGPRPAIAQTVAAPETMCSSSQQGDFTRHLDYLCPDLRIPERIGSRKFKGEVLATDLNLY